MLRYFPPSLYSLAPFLEVRSCNERLNILITRTISYPSFQRYGIFFSYNQQNIGMRIPLVQCEKER